MVIIGIARDVVDQKHLTFMKTFGNNTDTRIDRHSNAGRVKSLRTDGGKETKPSTIFRQQDIDPLVTQNVVQPFSAEKQDFIKIE